jgi:multimeric flavodoxin WrbA
LTGPSQVHKQLGGKVGAAFTSSGGTSSGAETTLLSIVYAMLIHGMIVQGRADDAHYGVAVMGAPSKEDLADCEELGRRVATLVLKLNQLSNCLFALNFLKAHFSNVLKNPLYELVIGFSA